jgi:hypothetical protein
MKKNHPFLLALVLTVTFSACVKKRDDANSPTSKSHSFSTHTIPGGVDPDGNGLVPIQTDLSTLQVGVGTRDFNQIQMTMSQLTGIDHRDTNVQTAFAAVTNALPSNNDVKTLSGPNIVSIAKLAATYCDRVVATSGPQRTALFPGVNFAAGPNTLTTAARDTLLTNLLSKFTKDKAPAAEDLTELKSLYDDLRGTLTTNTTATTAGLMVGVCTAALGSARSIVVY